MKKNIFLFFILFPFILFAQKEANIWYFGYNAGLDFNTGNPRVLLDGQLSTNEGCASISDSDGNLVFYTDGITVYNKNHEIMQNGTGLNGNPSSTHSAIIVPKPGTTNIYYIFTVDSLTLNGPGVNGLQFSEVNISLNSGFGAVTSKNNLLYSSVNEKVTAIKKPNSDDYWVVAHKYDSFDFLTYDITSLGVNKTSIISSIGSVKSFRTTGQIKISPDGSKLATSWTGKGLEVFNFNIETGKITNLIFYTYEKGAPYGLDFSPNSNLLYVSNTYEVSQYNLKAGAEKDIENSRIQLEFSRGAYSSVQLGPDGKIYIAKTGRSYIDVIEKPNTLGTECKYKYNEIYLEGKRSGLGLPTFVTSLFYNENISFENNCFEDATKFTLSTNVDSVEWNFDDPTTGADNFSTQISPIHQFSNSGIYNVIANVVNIDGTKNTIPQKIEIFDAPKINKNVSLKQCDNSDIDGFSFFNLSEVKEKIIANSDDYTITFHEEKIDAENGSSEITNFTNYKNEEVSIDKIWARVENSNGCYEISEVNLFVSTTQIPANFINNFFECDDGTNTTDGIATFDFSSATDEVRAIFPANQPLTIKYYRDEADALSEENEITDITNYQNIGFPNQQDIYVRVDNDLNNDCIGLGVHVSLNVEVLPVANAVAIDTECDNDRDGLFSFDSSTFQSTIIGNQTNVSVGYFDENNNALPSPLPNPYITATAQIRAVVTNTNSQDPDGQCSAETILSFVVSAVPIANPVAIQEECDDDFDGISGFDTSTIQSTVVGSQTNLVVKYFNENNNPLPSPLPNPFISTSQTIRVRLENPDFDICVEETFVEFSVKERPSFDLVEQAILCITDNSQVEISITNPNNRTNTYVWLDENNDIVSTLPNAIITRKGLYNVIATSDEGCASDMKQVLVNESSISTLNINDIEIKDDSDDNTISIDVSNLGLGDYEFRLLNEDNIIIRNYQDEPFFDGLDGGIYTIEVNDKNVCGSVFFEVSLLEFPKFFTPNNDAQNDFWQIKGISKNFYESGKINILNRYGALITTFTIDDIGWDGTYGGKNLPSNDYWFYAELLDRKNVGRVRRGNFSLLRK
jgi:gliding motility-associated-like protein